MWSFTGNVLSAAGDVPGFSTPQTFAKVPDAANRVHFEDRNAGFVNWNAATHPSQWTRWFITRPTPENHNKV